MNTFVRDIVGGNGIIMDNCGCDGLDIFVEGIEGSAVLFGSVPKVVEGRDRGWKMDS